MPPLLLTVLCSVLVGWSAAPPSGAGATGPFPEAPTAPLAWPLAEDFLRNARVVDRDSLERGVTHSHRLMLERGGRTARAVWKTVDEYSPLKDFRDGRLPEIGFRDSYRSEIAAYELDKLLGLGLVPPTVARRIRGREGSLQLWVEGAVSGIERRQLDLRPPDLGAWANQISMVRLLRQLTHDTDYNNLGNVLCDRDFRVYAIDFSRAFRTRRKLLEGAPVRRYPRAVLERLRTLTAEELEDALGRWLERGQRRAILGRRDLLVAAADASIAELGEAAVVY